MVKAAELRDGDDPALDRRLPSKWTLLLERQMGTPFMVVAEIQTQYSFQMPGVKDHEMVQALSPDRADQTLDVRIGVSSRLRSIGGLDTSAFGCGILITRCSEASSR